MEVSNDMRDCEGSSLQLIDASRRNQRPPPMDTIESKAYNQPETSRLVPKAFLVSMTSDTLPVSANTSSREHYRVEETPVNGRGRLKLKFVRMPPRSLQNNEPLTPAARRSCNFTEHTSITTAVDADVLSCSKRAWKKHAAHRARRLQVQAYYKRERAYKFTAQGLKQSGLLHHQVHRTTPQSMFHESKRKVHWNPLVYHINSGENSHLVSESSSESDLESDEFEGSMSDSEIKDTFLLSSTSSDSSDSSVNVDGSVDEETSVFDEPDGKTAKNDIPDSSFSSFSKKSSRANMDCSNSPA